MHVAIVMDQERLSQEQNMLNRLCIGLMAEGVQVTRIVPEGLADEVIDQGEQRVALAARLAAPMRVLPWMNTTRTSRLVEAMEPQLPDAVYAVGRETWAIGASLAAALERPLVIDVWSAAIAKAAPQSHAEPTIAAYIAPCTALLDILKSRVEPDMVSLVPMGVWLPKQSREAAPQVLAIAALGGATDVAAYRAMLNGVAAALQNRPPVQIVLELHGPYEHEIWREAERANLLNSISAISHASTYRSLISACDVLLLPERSGEVRSVLLEVMGTGLPIMTAEDPVLDMLIRDETAIFVRTSDQGDWQRRLTSLLDGAAERQALGMRARQYVAAHHSASGQIQAFQTTLDRVVHGDSLRFQSRVP